MHLPGRPLPDISTRGPHTPGFETPGGPETVVLSGAGIATDSTGTTDLGTADGDRDLVVAVTVNADASDFDFNINIDGSPLFDTDQSPAGTNAETFQPDGDDEVVVAAADETVQFEVINPSGTNNATADVDVDIVSEAHI